MQLQHSFSAENEEYTPLAEINIIPLVDVMLVLLIIFMVAAPLSISGIGVELPRATAKGAEVDSSRLILSINQKGQYYIEKMGIEADSLPARMQSIFASRSSKQLYIRADRKVLYEKVIFAMSAAKQAGVNKISMLTVPLTK